MKSKNNFSLYRDKRLIASKLEQLAAHKRAKEDAITQLKLGKTHVYILKGTFYDGKVDSRIGTFNPQKNRIYWKFVKPD